MRIYKTKNKGLHRNVVNLSGMWDRQHASRRHEGKKRNQGHTKGEGVDLFGRKVFHHAINIWLSSKNNKTANKRKQRRERGRGMSNETKDRWRDSQGKWGVPRNTHTHTEHRTQSRLGSFGLEVVLGPRCKGFEAVHGRTTHSRTYTHAHTQNRGDPSLVQRIRQEQLTPRTSLEIPWRA